MIITYLVMYGQSKWLGWPKRQRCVRIFSREGAHITCGTAKFELYTENAEAWEHDDYSFSPQCESESC